MTRWTYLPRVVDSELETRLAANGAVLVEGPKACGKTETARQLAASEVLLDIDVPARQAAELDPGLVLAGEPPRLIDEWQIVPGIWNRVRRELDVRKLAGQFVLTGSAVPADDETRHTGAMRFGKSGCGRCRCTRPAVAVERYRFARRWGERRHPARIRD